MPVQECQLNGVKGWKWGSEGKCYIGENAKEQATQQGQAIEISKMRRDEKYFQTIESLKSKR